MSKTTGEMPSIGIMGFGTWTLLAQDFTSQERYNITPAGGFGADKKIESLFRALDVAGVPFYADPYCPEGVLYLVNTNYLSLYLHERAAFSFTGFESTLPNNQLGYVGAILTLSELVDVKCKAHGKFAGRLGIPEHLRDRIMARVGGACFPFRSHKVAWKAVSKIELATGGSLLIPVQTKDLVVCGSNTAFEYFDPIAQGWRTLYAAGQGGFASVDGYNYRFHNTTGTVTATAVTGAGSGATTNGIGTAATGVTAAVSAGSGATIPATVQPVIGGSVQAPTITQAGSLFMVPPLIVIDPPPSGGTQATAICTLTASPGGVSTVVMVHTGAGQHRRRRTFGSFRRPTNIRVARKSASPPARSRRPAGVPGECGARQSKHVAHRRAAHIERAHRLRHAHRSETDLSGQQLHRHADNFILRWRSHHRAPPSPWATRRPRTMSRSSCHGCTDDQLCIRSPQMSACPPTPRAYSELRVISNLLQAQAGSSGTRWNSTYCATIKLSNSVFRLRCQAPRPSRMIGSDYPALRG